MFHSSNKDKTRIGEPLGKDKLDPYFYKPGVYVPVRFPVDEGGDIKKQGHAVVPSTYLLHDKDGVVKCLWPSTLASDIATAETRIRKCWSPLDTYEVFPIESRGTSDQPFYNYIKVNQPNAY